VIQIPDHSPADEAPKVSTTDRVLAQLTVLAEAREPLSLSQIAERVGLPRATTHRFVRRLVAHGMAEAAPDGSGYVAGREFHRLAALLMRGERLETLAVPVMRSLVEATGETSLLAVYSPRERRLAWTVAERGTRVLGYSIDLDTGHPLVWGASGRAILAFLPQEEIAAILARDADVRSNPLGTLPPPQVEMYAELERIRHDGYALSLSHVVPHAFSIAAPVFDATDQVRGALSLTIPEMRVDDALVPRMAPVVVAKAGELSRMLGATRGRDGSEDETIEPGGDGA
jgi:DNA-binding IclR family transcriptional regulator